MSTEWVDRLAAAFVTLLFTAALGCVLAVMGQLLYGDPTRVGLGVVLGLTFGHLYRHLRDES